MQGKDKNKGLAHSTGPSRSLSIVHKSRISLQPRPVSYAVCALHLHRPLLSPVPPLLLRIQLLLPWTVWIAYMPWLCIVWVRPGSVAFIVLVASAVSMCHSWGTSTSFGLHCSSFASVGSVVMPFHFVPLAFRCSDCLITRPLDALFAITHMPHPPLSTR
jgi:hypothetical protein